MNDELDDRRIDRESLKPGDHIYSWRTAYIYSHHGIYVGDDSVIHFTRRGQEVGTGAYIDLLLVSSGPYFTQIPCSICTPSEVDHGVVISCLNCFLSGGILYRFEYGVSPALFLLKVRGGTCTLAVSDPPEDVVDRAKYLLKNGFGCYNLFKNNCEDFAIYCKTGLIVLDQGAIGQGGQVATIVNGPLATLLVSSSKIVAATNICGIVCGLTWYCAKRYAADIGSGTRKDVEKISAEDLTRRLRAASGD
ncbi:hypothetical protein SAY86_024931 [Trapa natans]|uniref:LRAT domain-containing protein n=1 Tax=Trapa natans TaxID=22666 RepID=A0AAN7MR04_TRANT|nr:hypothetical protein SAY86_024931 [Trapa natans]